MKSDDLTIFGHDGDLLIMNLRCKSAWIHYKEAVSCSGINGSRLSEKWFPSCRNHRFLQPDRWGKTFRNTHAAYRVCDKVELITPARFLFDAGSTPKLWNMKMLQDEHLKVIEYEEDASKIFPNTEIKGGVAITYREDVYMGFARKDVERTKVNTKK